ncbi:MAG: diacylglycerol kinase family protein [Coriobacteriia bacterium]
MRILIVVNLSAGQGDAGLYEYVRELGRAGAEVVIRFIGPDSPIGASLDDAASFDRVVAAGGDGTASFVAFELRDSNIPVVVFPKGTANLLALNLQMPVDPLGLAETTLRGRTVRTDLAAFAPERPAADGRPGGFVIMAGAGFDASIMRGAKELKPVLGAGAYLLSAVQNLQPTIAAFTLDLDGRTVRTEGIAVLLVNFARIQFDLAVTHSSDPSDGLLEVVVFHGKTMVDVLPVVWAALLDRLGDHPDRMNLEIYTAASVRVASDPPLHLQADGEVVEATTPFEARVLPQAATFVIP